MAEQDILNRLSVIAKLLAIQITEDMDKQKSAWILKQSGMSNKEIAEFLRISNNAVAAHIYNENKQLEKARGKGRKRKKEDE